MQVYMCYRAGKRTSVVRGEDDQCVVKHACMQQHLADNDRVLCGRCSPLASRAAVTLPMPSSKHASMPAGRDINQNITRSAMRWLRLACKGAALAVRNKSVRLFILWRYLGWSMDSLPSAMRHGGHCQSDITDLVCQVQEERLVARVIRDDPDCLLRECRSRVGAVCMHARHVLRPG